MKFSIWYNEKPWFLELIEEKKDNISSVYFALPKEIGNSWRPVRQNEWNYNDKIKKLLILCKNYNIDTILLLNATIESQDDFSPNKIKVLFDYIEKITEYWLTSISVTNMLYMTLLKKKFPDIRYFSSVNCRLKTVEQAIFFQKLWIDVLTIDRDINRDINLIKKIEKRTGLEIQLMLNEPCIKNCPFRNTHFETVAYNSEKIFSWEFEDYTCYPMIKENKRLFFRIPFVRPEDLKYYKEFVNHFKLVTRDASNEKIKFLIDIYNKETYSWNLIDIFDIEKDQYLSKLNINNEKLNKYNFFDKISKCPWDCDICNLCDIFL